MEYLQVFDDNKVALEEKVLREEKYNLPKGKHFMIVIIFIENSKGEFLLQKTSKSRHSCIATTGGHVTYGDSSLYTIVKECKEELDIDINQNEVKLIGTTNFKNCFIDTYYIQKDIDINSLTLQAEEVEYVNWYTKDQIEELIEKNEFREGNIEPFKKVIEYKNTNV